MHKICAYYAGIKLRQCFWLPNYADIIGAGLKLIDLILNRWEVQDYVAMILRKLPGPLLNKTLVLSTGAKEYTHATI